MSTFVLMMFKWVAVSGDCKVGTNNKSLVNAARYIDAIYDVQIDENHPNLDQIILKAMQVLNSPEVEKYWYAYQLEIDPNFVKKIEELAMKNKGIIDKKEVRDYRGVLIEGDAASNIEMNNDKNIKHIEKRRAKILPFGK